MNAVLSCDSSSSSTWWYPFRASKTAKWVIPFGRVLTISQGVGWGFVGLMTCSFNLLKSTQMRIPPWPFLWTTTMGCSHSVACEIGAIIPWETKLSSSVLRASCRGSGTLLLAPVFTGVAPGFSSMWWGSPFIALHWSEKTSLNSFAKLSKTELPVTIGGSLGCSGSGWRSDWWLSGWRRTWSGWKPDWWPWSSWFCSA